MSGGITEGRDSVMVGTSLRLTPATISYTWWVVYVLSSAAARGGAISADSALHLLLVSPFLFIHVFALSLCRYVFLCFVLPCMYRSPLFYPFTVSRIPRRGVNNPLDSVSVLGACD